MNPLHDPPVRALGHSVKRYQQRFDQAATQKDVSNRVRAAIHTAGLTYDRMPLTGRRRVVDNDAVWVLARSGTSGFVVITVLYNRRDHA